MKHKQFDKIRNKYTKATGYIDSVLPMNRYRVRVNDNYEWWQGTEIELIIGESKKPETVEVQKKNQLSYLG